MRTLLGQGDEMSKLTDGFEERVVPAWEFLGGARAYGQNDVDQLLVHTRALEAMLRKAGECHEGCPICESYNGHSPKCELAKLLD